MGNLVSTDSAIDRALEIRRLHDEVETLKEDNNQLRKELMHVLNHGKKMRSAAVNTEDLSQISAAQVDAFVDKLLADPDTNLSFVPDMIERPAQRTMLLFLLKAIGHAVDTTTIEFMGHEIVMKMKPIEPNLVEEPELLPRNTELNEASFDADAIPL